VTDSLDEWRVAVEGRELRRLKARVERLGPPPLRGAAARDRPASIARRLSCLSRLYHYGIRDAELLRPVRNNGTESGV
jgi:hypothetical protein